MEGQTSKLLLCGDFVFCGKVHLEVLLFDLDEKWKIFEISDLQPKIVSTEGIGASL